MTIGSCTQPASATPLKQPSPSVTTLAPRFIIRPVIFLMFFFVNRRRRRAHRDPAEARDHGWEIIAMPYRLLKLAENHG